MDDKSIRLLREVARLRREIIELEEQEDPLCEDCVVEDEKWCNEVRKTRREMEEMEEAARTEYITIIPELMSQYFIMALPRWNDWFTERVATFSRNATPWPKVGDFMIFCDRISLFPCRIHSVTVIHNIHIEATRTQQTELTADDEDQIIRLMRECSTLQIQIFHLIPPEENTTGMWILGNQMDVPFLKKGGPYLKLHVDPVTLPS